MSRYLTVFLALSQVAAYAEPHLGFNVEVVSRKPMVVFVYPFTTAQFAGVTKGDVVLSVGGRPVAGPKDIADFVAAKKVGDKVRIKLRRNNDESYVKVSLEDGDDVRAKQAERDDRAKESLRREREAREREAALRAEQAARTAKHVSDHGPLLFVGRVTDDVLGQPQITILAENLSRSTVDAVRFRVSVFDKFGDPVPDSFGAGHEKEFLYQKPILAGEKVVINMGVPWHATVGVAKIVASEYVLAGGEKVVPPRKKVVEVRR